MYLEPNDLKLKRSLPQLFELHQSMDKCATLYTHLPEPLRKQLKDCSDNMRKLIDEFIYQK